MDIYVILLLFIAVVIIALLLRSLFISSITPLLKFFHGGDDLKTLETGTGPTIILIPGLGNGTESYNWNTSNEEQRNKTGLPITDSLQNRIADMGFHVVSFDPPGHESNLEYPIPKTMDEYISMIHGLSDNIVLIIGHSIGGRIAQAYGEKYNIRYIMLDPTPDYIMDNMKYTKHIENPQLKYQKTHEFVEMIKRSANEIKLFPWRPKYLIYNIDDSDIGKEQKELYFTDLTCNKIKLHNATHWVHISNPSVICDAISE